MLRYRSGRVRWWISDVILTTDVWFSSVVTTISVVRQTSVVEKWRALIGQKLVAYKG